MRILIIVIVSIIIIIASPLPPAMATATDQAKTVELKGTVVDAAGAPLKAVRLWLWQDHETQRTESLPDGTFAFPKALPQPAGLVAFRDDLAIGGMKVPVPAFEPVKLTLTEKDSLAIKTVNASFDPVVGARIKALLVNDAFSVPVDDLTPEGFPSFRSDDNGLLVFNNLPKSGHVRLMAAHREFADTSVAYLPIGGKPLPVVLYAGVRLRGRVTSHDNKGAARARLTLVRKASGAQDVAEFVTDPEGFYNVMVRADEYYVAVRHPNFSSPKPSLFVPSDQEDGNVLDLALLPPHIIQGTVVLPDGKACPGTPVSYFIDRVLYQETLTQHDGSFSLNVPDGPGQIHVLPPNGLMTETLNDIPVDKPQPQMQLAPIKLKSLPLIEGICQNNDGAPLPNTLISSLDLKPAAWAIAGPDGRFKFQLCQLPDEAKATFRAETDAGFLRGEFQVTFQDMKPAPVVLQPFEPDLAPRPSERAQNNLTDLIGKPAPELAVEKWLQGGPTSIEALKGKVVLMVFWGGFDQRIDALDRMEELRALYDLMKTAGDVAFLGVHDAGQDDEEIRKYLKNSQIPFPIARDVDTFKTFSNYMVKYIPQVVLIDKKGLLRFFRVEGRLLELVKALRRE